MSFFTDEKLVPLSGEIFSRYHKDGTVPTEILLHVLNELATEMALPPFTVDQILAAYYGTGRMSLDELGLRAVFSQAHETRASIMDAVQEEDEPEVDEEDMFLSDTTFLPVAKQAFNSFEANGVVPSGHIVGAANMFADSMDLQAFSVDEVLKCYYDIGNPRLTANGICQLLVALHRHRTSAIDVILEEEEEEAEESFSSNRISSEGSSFYLDAGFITAVTETFRRYESNGVLELSTLVYIVNSFAEENDIPSFSVDEVLSSYFSKDNPTLDFAGFRRVIAALCDVRFPVEMDVVMEEEEYAFDEEEGDGMAVFQAQTTQQGDSSFLHDSEFLNAVTQSYASFDSAGSIFSRDLLNAANDFARLMEDPSFSADEVLARFYDHGCPELNENAFRRLLADLCDRRTHAIDVVAEGDEEEEETETPTILPTKVEDVIRVDMTLVSQAFDQYADETGLAPANLIAATNDVAKAANARSFSVDQILGALEKRGSSQQLTVENFGLLFQDLLESQSFTNGIAEE